MNGAVYLTVSFYSELISCRSVEYNGSAHCFSGKLISHKLCIVYWPGMWAAPRLFRLGRYRGSNRAMLVWSLMLTEILLSCNADSPDEYRDGNLEYYRTFPSFVLRTEFLWREEFELYPTSEKYSKCKVSVQTYSC